MFVDYLTLMLVNMAAGLAVLALFVLKYIDGDRKKLAPGLLVSGFVALVTGLHMIFAWPIIGSYNIPFGEMSVLFGALLLGEPSRCSPAGNCFPSGSTRPSPELPLYSWESGCSPSG